MATTSGGKTLLVPTPFALKMALLDACIRTQGRSEGERFFPAIRDLQVAARPPERIVVNNTFMKILRPVEIKDKKTADQRIARARASKQWPYQRTIAYREFVQFDGPLALAFAPTESLPDGMLAGLLTQIHYLGKRGGFMQLLGPPTKMERLPSGFTRLNPSEPQPFHNQGTLQWLDDCGPAMTFAHADIYSGKKLRANREDGRVFHSVVLPYRLVRSSRSFSYYERI
jgi:hypothetical protein